MVDREKRSGLGFWLRVAIALGIVGGLAAFLRYGPTEAELVQHQGELKAWVNAHFWEAWGLFFLLELILVGISAPVGTGMSLLAGFLFGRWYGTLAVSFASTGGAVLAMLAVRYLFREPFRRMVHQNPRWSGWLTRIDRGIEREGWYYLLLIRMMPVLPFFAINAGMGLTKIHTRTYAWISQLGMLPITFLVVSAGAEVGEIRSFREMFTLERAWPILMLILLPIALRQGLHHTIRRAES